ncbi:Eukaryotic translation initiation factor 3 subunit D [Takifugu flavidus]|uniref:Eukaryotic translation initiation factor 3 subunit D n=1 Tax=Takifugu flavidus TaxID=433684 RepID=A0A5C6NSF7_9TELE|nr:Eukaryotic translation initiation factor 3 subunit D [Takifugu flavidus]
MVALGGMKTGLPSTRDESKLDEGKYLILKDPNKQVIRVYSLPDGTFSSDEEEEEEDEDEEEEEEEERITPAITRTTSSSSSSSIFTSTLKGARVTPQSDPSGKLGLPFLQSTSRGWF